MKVKNKNNNNNCTMQLVESDFLNQQLVSK